MENKFKVLRVVISTQRLSFLDKTLKSVNKLVNYSDLDMHHVIIDDWPKGRDDKAFTEYCLSNGFDEVILNKENIGVQKMLDKIMDLGKDYDYVFMHEDDVVLLKPLVIRHMITLLESDSHLSQIQMKRNSWYSSEPTVEAKDSDWTFGNFRYEKFNATPHFWGMMSVWPAWVCRENIKEKTGYKLGENIIGWYLKNTYQKETGLLKTSEGHPMVEHIGEYTRGKRMEKGEPGWIDGVHDLLDDSDYHSKAPLLKFKHDLPDSCK